MKKQLILQFNYHLFILISCFAFTFVAFSAGINNSQPYSEQYKLKKNIPAEKIKFSDTEKATYLEELEKKALNLDRVKGKIFRTKKNMTNSGKWETLQDGNKVWRLKVCAKGATGIGFNIQKLNIPDNARIYFYNADKSYQIGPFGQKDCKQHIKYLDVSAVLGEEVIIEYNEPKQKLANFEPEMVIASIFYRFAPFPMSFFEESMNIEQVRIEKIIADTLQELLIKTIMKAPDPGNINYTHTPDIDIKKDGHWTDIPNKGRIWRMGIHIDFAHGMALEFEGNFPEGSNLYVYTPDKSFISPLYKYGNDGELLRMGTSENNKIIIEYFEPKKQLGKSKLLLKRIQIRPILSSNQRIEDCTTPCSPNIVLASSPDLYDNYNGPSFADTGIDLTQINTLKKAVGANCNSPQPQTQQL